jgi:hypothetical protein
MLYEPVQIADISDIVKGVVVPDKIDKLYLKSTLLHSIQMYCRLFFLIDIDARKSS